MAERTGGFGEQAAGEGYGGRKETGTLRVECSVTLGPCEAVGYEDGGPTLSCPLQPYLHLAAFLPLQPLSAVPSALGSQQWMRRHR